MISLSDGAAFGEEEERALAIDPSRFPRLVETAADVIRHDAHSRFDRGVRDREACRGGGEEQRGGASSF